MAKETIHNEDEESRQQILKQISFWITYCSSSARMEIKTAEDL